MRYFDSREQHAYEDGNAAGQWDAMRAAVRLATDLRCATCGKPAACIGAYEAAVPVLPACDECCAHGCEDGSCVSLEEVREEPPR